MATNVGLLQFTKFIKAGGSYDMYTYVPYDWKKITAIRKRTPATTRGGSKDQKKKTHFESASLTKTVDLISEGPIEGFSDKVGNTIKRKVDIISKFRMLKSI